MLLADLAAASRDVAATASRTAKLERLADALRATAPAEVAIVTSYLSGELTQRRTGVGRRSLQGLPAAAAVPTLTVLEVDAAFATLAGLS
ncbi:MAG: lig, partial [Frankiales bacterium]|nr:lig [Frankiales bacterium]